MKKVGRKELKIEAIAYMRGSRDELRRQRKACMEAADVLNIEIVRFFWETKKSAPPSPSILKEILEYSRKNKIYLLMVEKRTRVDVTGENLIGLLERLEKNSIILLFIKPYRQPLYFSNIVTALKLFDHEKRKVKTEIYLQELKKQLMKTRKK